MSSTPPRGRARSEASARAHVRMVFDTVSAAPLAAHGTGAAPTGAMAAAPRARRHLGLDSPSAGSYRVRRGQHPAASP